MKKKVIALLLAAVMLLTALPLTASAVIFNDTATHWALKDIEYWTNDGSVTGYNDRTFRADKFITRAEFCEIIAKVIRVKYEGTVSNFPDVTPDDWFYDSANVLYTLGLVTGYEDGTFRGDWNITRNEAGVIVARTIKLTDNADPNSMYVDKETIAGWAEGLIGAMTGKGIMTGYFQKGVFWVKGNQNITRAETVRILRRIDDLVARTYYTADPEGVKYGYGNRTLADINKARESIGEDAVVEGAGADIEIIDETTEQPTHGGGGYIGPKYYVYVRLAEVSPTTGEKIVPVEGGMYRRGPFFITDDVLSPIFGVWNEKLATLHQVYNNHVETRKTMYDMATSYVQAKGYTTDTQAWQDLSYGTPLHEWNWYINETDIDTTFGMDADLFKAAFMTDASATFGEIGAGSWIATYSVDEPGDGAGVQAGIHTYIIQIDITVE